jgi:Na+/H+-dicarboxylate symporter
MVPENIILSVSDNGLMLQVIFFAIFFGICLAMLPEEKVDNVKKFFNGTNEVFLKMVDIVMQAAPFFVFALMAGVISKMADTPAEVFEIFKGLGGYSLVVLAGLLFMIFVFYPLIARTIVRPLTYSQVFKRISPAQFLAFSTSSSAATLPVTMECVEENIGVSRNVTSFVLPIGATVNMDGTSLYQAVAVIFLAQLHMVDLSLGQQLTIVLTATLASIGSAAVPSAGLVMLIIVLQSVGLNPLWIAIIFPVDRILDMCRTVVNVTGDATVSTIIAKSENELNYVENP